MLFDTFTISNFSSSECSVQFQKEGYNFVPKTKKYILLTLVYINMQRVILIKIIRKVGLHENISNIFFTDREHKEDS